MTNPLERLRGRLHLEQVFETVLEEMQLDTDALEETFALQLELTLFQAYNRLSE